MMMSFWKAGLSMSSKSGHQSQTFWLLLSENPVTTQMCKDGLNPGFICSILKLVCYVLFLEEGRIA